jgi:hypothetical protein
MGSSLNFASTLAINTPAAVPTPNATAPKARIPRVSAVKNSSEDSFEPTAKPKKIVTMLINSFCAVLLKRSTTPDSFIKLPKQNIPTNGVAVGKKRIVKNKTASGKMIFSRLVTTHSQAHVRPDDCDARWANS